MSDDSEDRTASLMTPAKLAQLKVRPAPAASPAAWLDQLASDAGSGHVRRLADLRRQLASQVQERNDAPVAATVAGLGAALQLLDFSLVQPRGWLARATGKGREAAAAFAAQWAGAQRVGEDLAQEVRALHQRQLAQGSTADRTVVEVQVEVRSIDKIMEQGARWLQDMRNQLKAREAQGGDALELQKIREDASRCELLVTRLKQLRAVASVAQQVVARGQGAATRRVALLASLQQALKVDWPACQRPLAHVAEQAAASVCTAEDVEAARVARERMVAVLQQAGADGAGLHSEDQALAEELAALQESLQAAA